MAKASRERAIIAERRAISGQNAGTGLQVIHQLSQAQRELRKEEEKVEREAAVKGYTIGWTKLLAWYLRMFRRRQTIKVQEQLDGHGICTR